MEDQIYIQRRFTITRRGLTFSDAITLPKEEYQALTPDQIRDIKNERFNNWEAIVRAVPPRKTKAERLAEIREYKRGLQEQLDQTILNEASIEQEREG